MRQIEHGADGSIDSLCLVDASPPQPGAGEILIEVHYAGINGPDIVQRQGRYPPPPGANPVLGLEVSGRVAALGEGVSEWQVGDQVTALVPGGGYAEYCVTSASHALPIPVGMSLADAAGLPEVWFTAWANLVDMAHIRAGDQVLVHGGAGGVGMAATQLARFMGAKVFTTEGSAEKLAFCTANGADIAINFREQDFAEVIRAATGKRGLDIVLDIVGGPALQKNLGLLGREGRLLIVAFNQGSKTEFDFMPVLTRRLTIAGSTMRMRSHAEKTALRDVLRDQLWPAFADGRLRTHTFVVLPMAQVAEAHRLMESSRHIGKIILQMR